jgi:hypothetical protein
MYHISRVLTVASWAPSNAIAGLHLDHAAIRKKLALWPAVGKGVLISGPNSDVTERAGLSITYFTSKWCNNCIRDELLLSEPRTFVLVVKHVSNPVYQKCKLYPI